MSIRRVLNSCLLLLPVGAALGQQVLLQTTPAGNITLTGTAGGPSQTTTVRIATASMAVADLSGEYRIRVKADNLYVHEPGAGDKLVSTRFQVTDDFTRFILERQNDGSYRIRTKASNLYWHTDESADKLVSTRFQPDDDFTRYFFDLQSMALTGYA